MTLTNMDPRDAEEAQAEFVDALDEMVEAWRAFTETYAAFRRIHDRIRPVEGRTWNAYYDAQVQGEERGWLGGPFLSDVIEKIAQSV